MEKQQIPANRMASRSRRILKKTGILFILMLIGFISNGQQLTQTVKGQVVDRENQMPLPGANVVVLNTKPLKGASTDAEGYFRMEGVPVGRYNIEVSFLGYHPVLEEESKQQQRIIPDYSSAFSKQFGNMYYLDMTITFRNNKANYSSIWALQVKNILDTPMHEGFMYNYKENTVDESKAEVVSYKIEF